MKNRVVALMVAAVLIAASCGAEGADEAATTQPSGESPAEDTPSSGDGDAMFGTLESPCGEGDATVAENEAGLGSDKLYVGVGTDRDGPVRPGLMLELWDASRAFAKWCNDQGGVAGLEIELVDVDAKVLEVETAMATSCTDTFAWVGGAYAQDNLIFSGKEGTDFHQCGLIGFPAWAVSTAVNEGDGFLFGLPNPGSTKPATWLQDIPELFPDDVEKLIPVTGNLPSIKQAMDQIVAVVGDTDGWGEVLKPIEYDAIGAQDWNIIAQQVKSSGATAATFVGEASNYSRFGKALKEQDWDGLVFADANQYDQQLIDTSGPEAVEGFIERIAIHPFEEADQWPATQQFLDIMDDVGDAKIAALGVQTVSSFLLFAQSVNKCAESGDPITRKCVLDEGKKVTEWDGGGLHAVTNPGENLPAECSMLVQVVDGKFERLYPELGSEEDNGEGFHCGDPGTIPAEGDWGVGQKDPEGKYD